MPETALVIALILVSAMLCQWLAWRVRLPAILFLLLVGIAAGPILNWIDPDALFGDLLMPMVSLSVAIILFEGSLTLNFQEIKGVGKVVQRMVTIGALTTWVIVSLATYFIFGFAWQVCALFGAVVVVTGPTVIVPMLRSVRPVRKVANILRWEGIAIDPIGALLAVMTYEFIVVSMEQPALNHVLWLFIQTLLVGTAIGVLAGFILGVLLKKQLIPEYLNNLATLSLVLLAFSGSNAILHESGLLAVTVMGMWLANMKDVDMHPILNFKENLSVLLISVLFIVLAARIDLDQLLVLAWPALALLIVMQFVARPLKVLVSTVGLDVNWRERAMLSWIAPRGIVAAAIAAIFSERLIAVGYTGAEYLVPLTFSVIIGTVVFQSATARIFANMLGVSEPSARGFLIVGANSFSRLIAAELEKHEFRCLLVDSNWENIRLARMAGLETYYGSPVSEDAEIYIDLSGIGNLLALSHQPSVNVVAAIHYSADFGSDRVFSIQNEQAGNQGEKHAIASAYQGVKLFDNELSYWQLINLVAKGYQIKSTVLSEAYTWAMYTKQHQADRIPLFVIDNKGFIRPVIASQSIDVTSGSTIIALYDPALQNAEKEPI